MLYTVDTSPKGKYFVRVVQNRHRHNANINIDFKPINKNFETHLQPSTYAFSACEEDSLWNGFVKKFLWP